MIAATTTAFTVFGFCGMVVNRHRNLLVEMPKAFSTTHRALESLQLNVLSCFERFLAAKGFISQVLSAKASSPTIKYGKSLSSPGKGSGRGKPIDPSSITSLKSLSLNI